MNYQLFSRKIIIVTLTALLICIISFILVLKLGNGTGLDFQGASGVASILPSFAGVIIASIALHSYMKLEDPAYELSVKFFLERKKLLSLIELMIVMDQRFVNDMKRYKDDSEALTFYAKSLHLVAQMKLSSIIDVVEELSPYFEQAMSEKDIKEFLDVFSELLVFQQKIHALDMSLDSVKITFEIHTRFIELVALVCLDMEKFKRPDEIYQLLISVKTSNHLNSTGQRIAQQHAAALKQSSNVIQEPNT